MTLRTPQSRYTRSLAAVLLLGPAAISSLGAQDDTVIDQGIFVITEGNTVVGREEFTVRRGRSGAQQGFTVTAIASYPPSAAARTITVRLEMGLDSQLVAAEIQDRSASRRAILMRFAPRRITMRMVTADGESVREHPRRPRTLLAVESVFGVFAILPGTAPGEVWAISHSGDSPAGARLTDHGTDRIRVKGVERPLRHLSLDLETATHHLWFDGQGRLIQVSIPDRNVKAVRDSA